jgi:hypothetical protein
MSERDLFDEIARIAYELWERDGYIHGRDIEHWCEAEHVVISRLIPVEEEKPKKAKAPKKSATKVATKAKSVAAKSKKTSGSAKKA